MRTDDLIAALSADLPTPAPSVRQRLLPALVLALAGAIGLLLATVGVRTDLSTALHTARFPFKFVATLALAGAATAVVLRLSRPLPADPRALVPLLAPLVLLAAACLAELAVLPPDAWTAAAQGNNGLYCIVMVPLLSALPLAAVILALRHGAPSSPGLAGAAAGLLSASLGATVYAIHCTDDSPLFLALWYGAATIIVTLAGGLAGRHLLRW